MLARVEQLLQRGSNVTSSLLPAIFNIFGQWSLTGAQQMTLLGLSNEKTLYNWKSQPEKAKLTRGSTGTGQLYPGYLQIPADTIARPGVGRSVAGHAQ